VSVAAAVRIDGELMPGPSSDSVMAPSAIAPNSSKYTLGKDS